MLPLSRRARKRLARTDEGELNNVMYEFGIIYIIYLYIYILFFEMGGGLDGEWVEGVGWVGDRNVHVVCAPA